MKIWFDLSNSPHINMFAALIRELQHQHDVIITCRPLANTIDLLRLHGLEHTVVGRHYGKALWAKVSGYPVRVWELYRFLRPQHIDVAISQSSFHSPVVARLLGIRSIYMNDNEHAMGNIPAFLAASVIMVPEFLQVASLKRQFAAERKVQKYPGVKEGIYLWELHERLRTRGHLTSRTMRARKKVYIRPEPWTAQYYQGASNFMDAVVAGLAASADVVVLPRGGQQAEHYKAAAVDNVRVAEAALDIADIAPDCDLFIGAGGTMTREMAVLGIPTISVYQDALLDVDRYLLSQGAFLHRPALTAAEAIDYLQTMSRQPANSDLLQRGRAAYELIRRTVLAAPC